MTTNSISPAGELFNAMLRHSAAVGNVPRPDGSPSPWQDAIEEVKAVVASGGVWRLHQYPAEWWSEIALSLGRQDRSDQGIARNVCEVAHGYRGRVRIAGREIAGVAEFQRNLLILVMEAIEGRFPVANKTVLRRRAVCQKCGRFLCEVEVLLDPTPIGEIAEIKSFRCRHCRAEASIKIEVQEASEK